MAQLELQKDVNFFGSIKQILPKTRVTVSRNPFHDPYNFLYFLFPKRQQNDIYTHINEFL